MKLEIEKRLHRAKITLDKTNIICPRSKTCPKAENAHRCNEFFEKCSEFNDQK